MSCDRSNFTSSRNFQVLEHRLAVTSGRPRSFRLLHPRCLAPGSPWLRDSSRAIPQILDPGQGATSFLLARESPPQRVAASARDRSVDEHVFVYGSAMPDQIRVLPDDVERHSHPGKHLAYWYRRFHIRSIDAWGSAKYSRVLELSGRDAQVWIATYLEKQLADMSVGSAKQRIAANSPVHVPLPNQDEMGP